ncbi:tripartite tricarboxylate transporter substrate binding protein [Candidimonas humi]|uniref:Bug family tripartite tricarboxylate transporter substrate binding protein n=1 Tax=Candidimonas humi TaxID=683355 RepID=A0ABV8P1W2_9BURK|nr:tripartite tricarboxylate transporter substrate binding protein [Candidimonas humi]MBV6306363.1 tripartite tricarboxylate transporter substrate binding protein [Candidimonas humi]
MKLCSALLASIAAMASIAPALAQAADYPSKPITVVVPYPAGGVVDLVARSVGNQIGNQMHQSIVVKDKPGASGRIGGEEVSHASPDGYTLLFAASPLTINPSVYLKLKGEPFRSFTPVALVGIIPSALVVSAKSPDKTLADFVAAAKAKPSAYNYGSIGDSTPTHLAIVQLQQRAGIKLTAVPYTGQPPAQLGLLRGDIQLMATSVALVQSQMRPLAVTSLKRSHLLPDVPAAAETYPGYQATTWFGIMAPKGTPAPIVQRLYEEVAKAVQQPDVRKRLDVAGMDVQVKSPADFLEFLKADQQRWAELVKAAGIKPQ